MHTTIHCEMRRILRYNMDFFTFGALLLRCSSNIKCFKNFFTCFCPNYANGFNDDESLNRELAICVMTLVFSTVDVMESSISLSSTLFSKIPWQKQWPFCKVLGTNDVCETQPFPRDLRLKNQRGGQAHHGNVFTKHMIDDRTGRAWHLCFQGSLQSVFKRTSSSTALLSQWPSTTCHCRLFWLPCAFLDLPCCCCIGVVGFPN